MNTTINNLPKSAIPYYLLKNYSKKQNILIVVDEEEITEYASDATAISEVFFNSSINILTFPSKSNLQRVLALAKLSTTKHNYIVTSPQALEQKTFNTNTLKKNTLNLSNAQHFQYNNLANLATTLGYERTPFVEQEGQFSKRGEVFDIWPAGLGAPVRIVFYYDSIESLRNFDPVTQLSEGFLNNLAILPATEEPQTTLAEILKDSLIMLFTKPDFYNSDFSGFENIILNQFTQKTIDANFLKFARWAGNIDGFSKELSEFVAKGFNTHIFCSNNGELERIEEIVFTHKLPENKISFHLAALEESFYSNSQKIAVITSKEVLYRRNPTNFPKFKSGRRLEGLWEIAQGDFVVHEKYGIGKYLGLKKIERSEQIKEYIAIEYRHKDKLYVPLEDFNSVQKYIGLEGFRPKLHSLDTVAWERAKLKAKESAKEIADELLKLYAQRQSETRQPYPAQTIWESELADSFAYEETPDQNKAISEVFEDLEKPYPMERLICGDVGFGKTEVAIRAAFKVASNSKQVAILVPTTVLAEQHYNTITNRLASFPIRVAILSRFQSKTDQKITLQAISNGNVDIVVGTHRLLQKDIVFKDLGLLIIDEEHRFGVKQKEKIKQMKKNADILLLSATPIPRTISMSLSNLKNLSVIETPPFGRLPIETHISHFNAETVKKIIEAELSRGGQVYYLHNQIQSIISKANQIKSIVPYAKTAVIHGQLKPTQIEKTMWDFLHRKTDILIATTIIESGLDIPSVNTMIIEDAENFGLAQLYQLRGRIGREKQKAYCYLFHSPGKLSEDAQKRLTALKEFSELGSGFRLALRDLEIRGAGNILGSSQHGFAKEVGCELFSRLLEEASGKTKPSFQKIDERTEIDLKIAAYIPQQYIEQEDIRIIFYRKLASATKIDDFATISSELKDRFGNLPLELENLFEITKLRLLAQTSGISAIAEDENYLNIYFKPEVQFPTEKLKTLIKHYYHILEFARNKAQLLRFKKNDSIEPQKTLINQLSIFLSNIDKYATIPKIKFCR